MTVVPPPLLLPARRADAHKGTFGRVLLIGGSRGMSGSISLASVAALRCGSGLVSAAIPDRCLETVAASHPALMTIPLPDDGHGRFSTDASLRITDHIDGVDAVGCGPGMTTAPGSPRLVERLLPSRNLACVFDADAINCLAQLNWPDGVSGEPFDRPVVLTPHPGELARLTSVPASDRAAQVEAAADLCDRTGVVMVVKGGPTVVVAGSGAATGPSEGGNPARWTNSTGNPGMASGGSGDVLTGVITSLLGQGLSAYDAARLGVWVHGRAGDLAADRYGQAGMTAKEIVDALPDAIREACEH